MPEDARYPGEDHTWEKREELVSAQYTEYTIGIPEREKVIGCMAKHRKHHKTHIGWLPSRVSAGPRNLKQLNPTNLIMDTITSKDCFQHQTAKKGSKYNHLDSLTDGDAQTKRQGSWGMSSFSFAICSFHHFSPDDSSQGAYSLALLQGCPAGAHTLASPSWEKAYHFGVLLPFQKASLMVR